MSKNVYIGINNALRKVTHMYIGINGVLREIKAGYIGINGVPRQFFYPPYVRKFQSGTISSSYGVVNSYSQKYVDDHWELYMNSTITTSSSSYSTFHEIKVIPNSESLVGKTVTLTYKLNTYDSSGMKGVIIAFNSSNTPIKYQDLTSTSKTTTTFIIPSNTSWIVISNHIYKKGTYGNTLYIYSLKIGNEVLI